jgi:hypothetical protein
MMVCILVVVLVAKLRIGTGQDFEIPMLTGKILVRHVQPTPRLVLNTIHDIAHIHRTAQANALQSPSPSSHRDLGSLLNRLASANCW